MKFAISGASGLLGTALQRYLPSEGHEVQRLVRSAPTSEDEVHWSPGTRELDPTPLIGTDVMVHLAGEPIIGLRWTAEKKRRVLQSRRDGTMLIAKTLAAMENGPKVLLSASAVGFYGDTREWVDETSPAGTSFLAEVCQVWETSTAPAKEAGIRVVNMRIGVVLAADGGALEKMLPAFRLGLGAALGDGTQYMPWIAIDDIVRAIDFLATSDVSGPVNLVAPNPATNAEFTRALGDALDRPAALKVPSFALQAAMGAMGEETLLAGQRVRPQRLMDLGFQWTFPELAPALEHVLR